jgi:hypothetical protein
MGIRFFKALPQTAAETDQPETWPFRQPRLRDVLCWHVEYIAFEQQAIFGGKLAQLSSNSARRRWWDRSESGPTWPSGRQISLAIPNIVAACVRLRATLRATVLNSTRTILQNRTHARNGRRATMFAGAPLGSSSDMADHQQKTMRRSK